MFKKIAHSLPSKSKVKMTHLSSVMDLPRLCDLHLVATGVTAKGTVTLIRH